MTMVETLKIGDFVDLVDIGDDDELSVPVTPQSWLALRIQPNKERQVEERFYRKGVSCYLPCYERHINVGRWKHWTISRKRKVRTPIFPGLMFIPDFDANAGLKAISEGVGNFLKWRDADPFEVFGVYDPFAGYVRFPHRLLLDIVELERNYDQPQGGRKGLQIGDQVQIREGNPFGMWIGRIDRLDDKGRLRVLISIMQREVPVYWLTRDQVEPV